MISVQLNSASEIWFAEFTITTTHIKSITKLQHLPTYSLLFGRVVLACGIGLPHHMRLRDFSYALSTPVILEGIFSRLPSLLLLFMVRLQKPRKKNK